MVSQGTGQQIYGHSNMDSNAYHNLELVMNLNPQPFFSEGLE